MDGLEQSSPALPEELDALRARVAMLEQGEALQEILRTAALSRDVGVALVQDMPLQHSLQQIAQSLVHHLDAAFARIWTLNTSIQMLELQAMRETLFQRGLQRVIRSIRNRVLREDAGEHWVAIRRAADSGKRLA